MVITDRVQADTAPKVTPIINKRSSIRVLNTYEVNCDINTRISDQNIEQSLSNMSSNMSQSMDYLNSNCVTMKKDRLSLESNTDNRNVGNIRLCNSQSNDSIKSDLVNRQFSPWSAPVRNRVVARVVPYPHTSSTAPNISYLNTTLTSKSGQSTIHSIRSSNSIISQNLSRNIHKSYGSYQERDGQTSKQDSSLSVNHSYLHLTNDRNTDSSKRKFSFNQPENYRLKSAAAATSKSIDFRNAGHNLPSADFRFTGLSEVADKLVTTAEVFGEDFSDLSENESYSSPTTTMAPGNRKRKKKMSKRNSSSSDSSSTVSVLSTEKQNRFVRLSKPHYHNKSSVFHSQSFSRSSNPIKAQPCPSYDEQHNRHQISYSFKKKPEKKNVSMKPLTVNVSLTNFEDNAAESGTSTDNSSENSSKPLALKKGYFGNKKKLMQTKVNANKYRTKERSFSSSSDNEYNTRRFQVISSTRWNDQGASKISKYTHDRSFKETTHATKNKDVDSDHHFSRNISHKNSSHNFVIERRHHEKNSAHIYHETNHFIQREQKRSDSPLLKRQKLKHEKRDNQNLQRSLDRNITHAFSRHSSNKYQELSLDAAFQKEFDEFKRDQAGDISGPRKGNSSLLSSTPSTATKSFNSFKKFKSKALELSSSSSKYKTVCDTSDSKNIFQIDMNNINIYESMYDKVKRRAQQQAENKIIQHSGDIGEQRNRKKSKSRKKHLESKSYHRRSRKSRDIASPSSSRFSGTSSLVPDESVLHYLSSVYPPSNRCRIHKRPPIVKSTKPENWQNKDCQMRLFPVQQSYRSESKPHSVKHIEVDFHNENEDVENKSEFSYITSASNVINKVISRRSKEEVGNGSDVTVSTEPMEYAEVDLESLKMSDDDWKSGLSSQSSCECDGVDSQKLEIISDKVSNKVVTSERNYSPVRELIFDYCLETNNKLEINSTKDEPVAADPIDDTNCSLDNEFKESDLGSQEIETQESAKEEQDIAIASILLKEENEFKSSVIWEISLTEKSVKSSFVDDGKIEDDIIVTVNEPLEKYESEVTIATFSDENNVEEEKVKNDTFPEELDINPMVEASIDNGDQSHENADANIGNSSPSCEATPVDINTVSSSVIPQGLKSQTSRTTPTNTTSPIDKEDLTSYVKRVIERVMQEQSVENKNKLKFDKCTTKRTKKTSGSSLGISKPSSSTNSSTPVSLTMSLQKSPSASYQATIIESTEKVSVTSTIVMPGTPSIPGVNICAPLSNQISTETSSCSELKVNTDFTTLTSIISDVSSVSNSTHTPTSCLKSPNSDDPAKQRICTRLRRSDPNKSDGNYKVVMPIYVVKMDENKAVETNESQSCIKTPEEIVEDKQSTVIEVTDPYEPNFDESPLEMSHYRNKTKNIFFSNDAKSSRSKSAEETVSVTTVTTTPSSILDSVSQTIEDVANGNFNLSDYYPTSFKNKKMTSLHISPSTTPLTFVSNDSRDCSSISGDNPTNFTIDLGPVTHRKNSLLKQRIVPYNDDGKKLDNSLSINNTLSGNVQSKHAVTVSPDSVSCITADKISEFVSKITTTTNLSVSPICSTSNAFVALINPTILCRPIEHNIQKTNVSSNLGHTSFQNTSIQIQPFSILSTSVSLPIDKDVSVNSKFQLHIDSSLPSKSPMTNLLQPAVNSMLPVLQSADDKTTLKQFYLNFLQQRSGIGALDSSTLSQLQAILNDTQQKPLCSAADSNLYIIPQTINAIDPPTLALPVRDTNQEFSNPSLIGLPQNICSKFWAEAVIPREYPLVWEGKLSLKNEEAKVALHFVHGNSELLNACMQLLICSGSLQWNTTGSLKIVQRMRLDTSQLEGVQRRMQNADEHCIGLALPGGDDTNQWMRQSIVLRDGFIKYMKEKGAAGIINVCHPDNNQQGLYVVHIFPPCEFSTNQISATAPQLLSIVDNYHLPSLLVIITTV